MTEAELDKVEIPIGPDGPELSTIDQMFRFARCYLQSGLCPPGFKNPQSLIIAWTRAKMLGIPLMQALEGMSVIHNRLSLMGDLALALCEKSGKYEDKKVKHEGKGDSLTCTVEIKRVGRPWKTFSYSVAEAKEAGIYQQSSTWKGYPKRMTYYRALCFGLRDEFSDVLKGMAITEEVQDYVVHTPAEDDQQKYAESRAREAADKAEHPEEYVTLYPAPETPAQATEEAFPEDKAKPPAPHRQAPAALPLEDDIDMGEPEKPKEPAAPPPPPEPPPPPKVVAGEPAPAAPKEVTAPVTEAPPQKVDETPWRDHVIQGGSLSKFRGRRIAELRPAELNVIEQRFMPAAEAQWDNATESERSDYYAFKKEFAWRAEQKPW